MDEKLKNSIREILRQAGLPGIDPVLREIPFKGQIGLAFSNVFQLAREAYPDAPKKELKQHAEELSEQIAAKLTELGEFDKVEAVKGYVNCFFNPDSFARDITARILDGGTDWGRREMSGGKVMVEYSQPNTHKAFHIGHVRNVCTGAALVRCFRYSGRNTLAANYYGDIGSHVFKSLWHLEKFHPDLKDAPDEPKERGRWLGNVYAKAQVELDESKNLLDNVWDLLKPLYRILKNALYDQKLTFGLFSYSPDLLDIAKNEIDLFENTSTEHQIRCIDHLARHAPVLLDRAINSDVVPYENHNWEPARVLTKKLLDIIGSVDFHQILTRPLELIAIADRWNLRDPDLINLWEKTKKWSFDDFYRIYDELGAAFDKEFYESEVEEEGLHIVNELVQMDIVTESSGAKIVEIDQRLHEKFDFPLKDKYRVAVLVRADGASLYGAKDLALAKRKFEDFGIDESIYVVGNEQKFYFQQLFQMLRLMGFPQWEKCYHLSYELVMLPSGKISSRSGQVILYDDVMNELKGRALDVVREKNPSLDENAKLDVADSVAIGSLIYGMLRVDTNKKIEFDFDEVLDFNGRSAPYIQYACARASSIARKAASEGIVIPDRVADSDFHADLQPVEIDLVGMLGKFPDIVRKVADDKKPIHLATYAYDLAVAFSDFYHQCPVLTAEPGILRNRLLLVRAVRITLDAALGLLGIKAPDVM